MEAATKRTLWRLREVQAKLKASKECGTLLCVLGVDGRDNWAASWMFKWLVLGEEGPSLSAEHQRAVGNLNERGTMTADELEALEETVLMIGPTAVHVAYHPAAEKLLTPLLCCGAPILEYSYSNTDDADMLELSKIRTFVEMVAANASTKRFGIGLPVGCEDAKEEVEYWPLAQSFALEGRGPGGFLTQHVDIVDASNLVYEMLRVIDPLTLAKTASKASALLAFHVDELRASRETDVLDTFFDYGADEVDTQRPFVALGHASAVKCLTTSTSASCNNQQNEDTVVFEAIDPTSKFAVCRTYTRDHVAGAKYAKLVHQARDAVPKALTSVGPGSKKDEYIAEITAEFKRDVDVSVRLLDDCLAYVRCAFLDAPAVAVGDTYLLIDSEHTAAAGETTGLLTGDRAAPYFASWVDSNATPRKALRDYDGLGKKLDVFPSAYGVFIFEQDTEVSKAVVTGRLGVFDHALGLETPHGCVCVSFKKNDVKAVARAPPRLSDDDKVFAVNLELTASFQKSALVPPGLGTPTAMAVCVKRNSEAHRALSGCLDEWRAVVRASGDQTLFSDQRDYDMAASRFSPGVVDQLTEAIDGLAISQRLYPDDDGPLSKILNLEAFAASRRSAVLDALDPAWGRTQKKDTPLQNGVDTPNIDTYFLCGLPGSGCDEIAASILRREPGAWLKVDARYVADDGFNTNPGLDVDATATAVAAAAMDANATHLFPKQRLLVVAASSTATAGNLSLAIMRARGPKNSGRAVLRGGAAVVSSAHLASSREDKDGPTWPASLWLQCVPGLTTALVVVREKKKARASAQRALDSRAAKTFKAAGAERPWLVESPRGEPNAADIVESLVRPDAVVPPLDHPACVRARAQTLGLDRAASTKSKSTRSVSSPKATSLSSKSGPAWLLPLDIDATSMVRLDLAYDLDYHLLLKLLTTVLFPDAETKIRAAPLQNALLPVQQLSAGQNTDDTASSPSDTGTKHQPLKALFSLAKTKVQAKQRAADRLATLDLDVAYWRRQHGFDEKNDDRSRKFPSVLGISGRVTAQADGTALVGTGLALDANAASLSVWPDADKNSANYLLLLFPAGKCPPQAALADLVAVAAARRIRPRPRLSLENLSPDAVDAVLAKTSADLPPGWAFDGSVYLDAFGNRSKKRPDADTILKAHLDAQNALIDQENRALAL